MITGRRPIEADPNAADHPDDPRLRGHARAAVPRPHRSRAVRPVGRARRHGHPDRALGRAHRRQLAVRLRARRRRSTGSTAASTRCGRTGSCRPSPSRAIPTGWRWRRCGSRTSATAAPGCATQSLVDSFEGRDAWLRSGMEVGVDEGYAKLRRDARRWRCLTGPAERHRQVAGLFTERVRGTRSWDAPSPVAGWTARDVVRHLTEWFPAFLAAGAGIELPRGPSVDDDPVAAWQVHCDAVQAVLDDPETARPGPRQPAHRRAAAGRRDRPVLHRRRVHAHLGPGPGHRPGRPARPGLLRPAARPGWSRWSRSCAPPASTAPGSPVPDDADAQTRLLGFIGRDPDWTPR